MTRLSLLLLLFLGSANAGFCQNASMKLVEINDFQSQFIQARRVDVYLPEGYPKNAPYNVLYMHDGQNLSDTSFAFGGISWQANKVLAQLMTSNEVEPTILVGLWNTEKRYQEYAPMPAFVSLSDSTANKIVNEYGEIPYSDRYLSFLVKELKPFIDENYMTSPLAKSTIIAGSSMGGLISLYAICKYPEVFGSAGCVSIHWPILTRVHDAKLFDNFALWLKKNLPAEGRNRIYYDYGTETLDSLYEPYQLKIDEIMKASGYQENLWISRKYEGAAHNEASWNARLHEIFRYILPSKAY